MTYIQIVSGRRRRKWTMASAWSRTPHGYMSDRKPMQCSGSIPGVATRAPLRYTSLPIGAAFMNILIRLFTLVGAIVIISGSASAQWPDQKDTRATRMPDGKVDLDGPT